MSNVPDVPDGHNVIPYSQPAVHLPFRDRRSGLMVFGIVMIILGVLCGCLTAAMPLSLVAMFAAPGSIPGPRSFILTSILGAAVMYAGAATALIWTGIASIKVQKWVRPVVGVLSVLAIVASIIGLLSMLLSLPLMQQSIATATAAMATTVPATGPATARAMAPPPAAAAGMLVGVIFGLIFAVVIGIGVPTLFLWYYASNDTRLTLEHFDIQSRWTDGVPLPVLGVAITCAIGAAMLALSLVQQITLLVQHPWPGGWFAVSWYALMSILLALTTWMSFSNRQTSWSLALTAVLLGVVGWIAIAFFTDLNAQFAAMGLDPGQVKLLGMTGGAQRATQIASAILLGAAGLSYLFWFRRLFNAAGGPAAEFTED